MASSLVGRGADRHPFFFLRLALSLWLLLEPRGNRECAWPGRPGLSLPSRRQAQGGPLGQAVPRLPSKTGPTVPPDAHCDARLISGSLSRGTRTRVHTPAVQMAATSPRLQSHAPPPLPPRVPSFLSARRLTGQHPFAVRMPLSCRLEAPFREGEVMWNHTGPEFKFQPGQVTWGHLSTGSASPRAGEPCSVLEHQGAQTPQDRNSNTHGLEGLDLDGTERFHLFRKRVAI